MVFRSLSDILQCLWKIGPGYNYFLQGASFLDHLRRFAGFSIYLSATQLIQLFQVLSRAYSDIFKHYPRAYSRILRILCILPNLESWQIETPKYIHTTILNIFTKLYLGPQMLSNFQSNFIASLTLYFKTYLGIFKVYSAIFHLVNSY